MDNKDRLSMRFDPRTIEHLGLQMYSTLPPVIAELVSNAYDADADTVNIYLQDEKEKKIIVEDTGHGMDFNEINEKFLLIGRNRREKEHSEKSESGKRYVIGKKGIGKLAFFGIAEHVIIETVRNYKKTVFELDWDLIKRINQSDASYSPRVLEKEVPTIVKQGTKMILTRIKRKSVYSPEHLAISLAKSFHVFNEMDFKVNIYHNKVKEPVNVVNELRYDGIEVSFFWDFPKDLSLKKVEYQFSDVITGKLISAKETVPADMRGVALFSRGKLVNNYDFLDVKATSHGYSYITGWLDIDFIEEFDKDVISTNRQSLNWELEETSELKLYLETIYRLFFNEQKDNKRKQKEDEVKKVTGVDLDAWLLELPKHEGKLAQKLTDSILNAEGIDVVKAGELIKYTKDSFQFEAFREFASELDDVDFINTDQVIRLMKEWELIENREMYKLALGRVETIQKFEKHIKDNVNEVPTMSDFLKKFGWILDPRIREFENEVYYSQLLKQQYADDLETFKMYYEELESNRRIDFLCMGIANNYFIIELKKPEFKIREKDIRQAADYRSFIESHFGNDPNGIKSIVAYVVCGSIDGDRLAKSAMTTYEKSAEVYVKTYHELLRNAKTYHQEFITKFDSLKK
jgi:Histidine kinase-, DNA gyrase B-, and HSP90-like ATPase